MFFLTTIHGTTDQVDTSAKYPLGALFSELAGDGGLKVWRYVFNDEASTAFAAGHVCVLDTTGVTFDAVLSVAATPTAANQVIGVAQHAIAAGSYGWVQCYGYGTVLADTGGLSVNTGMIPGNAVNGAADDASAVTAADFGTTVAAIAAAATGTAFIRCI